MHQVCGAAGLRAADALSGASDPYVVAYLDGDRIGRTQTVRRPGHHAALCVFCVAPATMLCFLRGAGRVFKRCGRGVVRETSEPSRATEGGGCSGALFGQVKRTLSPVFNARMNCMVSAAAGGLLKLEVFDDDVARARGSPLPAEGA